MSYPDLSEIETEFYECDGECRKYCLIVNCNKLSFIQDSKKCKRSDQSLSKGLLFIPHHYTY